MKREALVSGGDAVQAFFLENAQEKRCVCLEKAGALCEAGKQVFCASRDMIVRLDRESLMPTAAFAGGPGVCELTLSQDGMRLYALCGEADSVLMLSREGEPLYVRYAGVNPQQMALDGDTLAIAGGESGYVLLLCAKTLRLIDALSMPGPVYSTVLHEGRIYALCLTPSLSSILVTICRGGARNLLFLPGMPGRVLAGKEVLLVQVEGALYAVSWDGNRIVKRWNAPGRASWMHDTGENLLMLDMYSNTLRLSGQTGWKTVACGVAGASCRSV